MGIGEGIQESQSASGAMLETDLQAVIIRIAAIERKSNIAKAGDGTVRGQRAGGKSMGLIEVRKQQQFQSVIAYIGDIHERIPCELALNGKEPTLHIAAAVVFRHEGDVRCERVKVARCGNACRITLICWPERR